MTVRCLRRFRRPVFWVDWGSLGVILLSRNWGVALVAAVVLAASGCDDGGAAAGTDDAGPGLGGAPGVGGQIGMGGAGGTPGPGGSPGAGGQPGAGGEGGAGGAPGLGGEGGGGCPLGGTICPCDAGACDAPTDRCTDDVCAPVGCRAGSEGCPCAGGGCDPGLACDGGRMCVDGTGREGGPCRADSACDEGLRCDRTFDPPSCALCDPGSLACSCREGDRCGPGLACEDGLCVGDEDVHSREPPAEPQCYTPCRRDLVDAGGGVRTCEADGLMRGCVGGLDCNQGTCAGPDEAPRECFGDNGCPDFQRCIRGICYAECQRDRDCGEGLGCHRRVCRAPCTLEQGSCGEGEQCASSNGQNGFCVPAGDEGGVAPPRPDAGFRLDATTLTFDNVQRERRVRLYNDGQRPITVRVRKVEHSILSVEGAAERTTLEPGAACVGLECPLWWLQMGTPGRLGEATEVEVEVPGRCGEGCPELVLRVPDEGPAAVRWRGVLEISSALGVGTVELYYQASAEGRWTGAMFYYGAFESAGIDSVGGQTGWLDRQDRGDLTGVANGLLQRWGAFRSGRLTQGFAELEAVLATTRNETWRRPGVEAMCPANEGACYLIDGGAGTVPRVYVAALDDAPIPTGSKELPLEVNLRAPDPEAPETLVGRIVSDTALHFPGDPEMHLEFAADPPIAATAI